MSSTYSVPEISCAHCKSAIESAVGVLDGVTRVDVDVDAKTVLVDGGQPDVIAIALRDAGYDIAP